MAHSNSVCGGELWLTKILRGLLKVEYSDRSRFLPNALNQAVYRFIRRCVIISSSGRELQLLASSDK